VKGSIILPLVQILLIIIISTLLCLGTYLFMYNNSFGPEAGLSIDTFISHLPSILLNIFPIVVLISVVLSLVNTLKTPANKGFAALFTLITASIIYYAGYTGIYMLNEVSEPSPFLKTSHLYINKINPLENSRIYLNGEDTVIEVKNSRDSPSFSIFRNI
jgi:hypothetical protein